MDDRHTTTTAGLRKFHGGKVNSKHVGRRHAKRAKVGKKSGMQRLTQSPPMRKHVGSGHGKRKKSYGKR